MRLSDGVRWMIFFFCMLSVHSAQSCAVSTSSISEADSSTVSDILHDIISKLDTSIHKDGDCHFFQWLEEHTANASSKQAHGQQAQCESISRLLRSFASNSLYSLFFKDICRVIWHYDEQEIETESGSGYVDENVDTRRLKRLVNKFISNDADHWKMFINDWRCLGLDETNKTYSDLLVYLFSDFTFASRKTVYDTIRIDTKIDGETFPQHRYIIVAVLEYMASTQLCPRMAGLYDTYQTYCNLDCELEYMSIAHCAAEDGHIDISPDFEHIVIAEQYVGLLRTSGVRFYEIMIELLNSFYTHQLHHFDSVSLWAV